MKKYLSVFIFLFSASLYGQAVIKKANRLIEQKQYATAYALLEDKDPDNQKPAIVLKKAELAMDYFVTSIMHQTFAFKDLADDEDLMKARLNNDSQTFAMYVLPLQEVLDTLIELNPENYELHKALGKFYYEVYLKYGDNWLMPTNELLKNMYDYSVAAATHHTADFLTYYNMGFYLTFTEQYAEAINAYHKSIELDSLYPTSHYNVAICYLYVDSALKGVEHAKKAIALYKSSELKADAARVTAVLYKAANKLPEAISYLEMSNQFQPDNYYTLSHMVETHLLAGHYQKAAASTSKFFELDPANPSIIGELFGLYTNQSADTLLFPILNQKIEEHKNDFEVLGNIYFHLARYYVNQGEVASARKLLIASRKNFEKVFEEDTPVFEVIDNFLSKYPEP